MIDFIKNKVINITQEDVLERLLDRKRWPKNYPDGQPSVEAIKEDGTKHQDFFDQNGYLDSLGCIECFEDGYTLVLSNAGSLFKDLWFVQQYLNERFNKFINCNLYFGSGKKSVSFPKHNHDYSVIVKNIYGESKWIIDEKEVILKNQECIWFDKFVDHQVIEINDAKLSLTCNIK